VIRFVGSVRSHRLLRVTVRAKRASAAGCPQRLARCVARCAASRGGKLRCAEAHALPTMMSISPTRLIDYANMAGREATSRQRCCLSMDARAVG
jgi:hypothetical protein